MISTVQGRLGALSIFTDALAEGSVSVIRCVVKDGRIHTRLTGQLVPIKLTMYQRTHGTEGTKGRRTLGPIARGFVAFDGVPRNPHENQRNKGES